MECESARYERAEVRKEGVQQCHKQGQKQKQRYESEDEYREETGFLLHDLRPLSQFFQCEVAQYGGESHQQDEDHTHRTSEVDTLYDVAGKHSRDLNRQQGVVVAQQCIRRGVSSQRIRKQDGEDAKQAREHNRNRNARPELEAIGIQEACRFPIFLFDAVK